MPLSHLRSVASSDMASSAVHRCGVSVALNSEAPLPTEITHFGSIGEWNIATLVTRYRVCVSEIVTGVFDESRIAYLLKVGKGPTAFTPVVHSTK